MAQSCLAFNNFIGALSVYIADYGETEPDLDDNTLTNWTSIGPTTGEQRMEWMGDVQRFSDNDTIGNTGMRRVDDGFKLTFTLVSLELEDLANGLGVASSVVTAVTSGALSAKGLSVARDSGGCHALLFRGLTHSAYGAWPAQFFAPRYFLANNPLIAFAKNQRAEPTFEWEALYDSAAGSSSYPFGRFLMQSS